MVQQGPPWGVQHAFTCCAALCCAAVRACDAAPVVGEEEGLNLRLDWEQEGEGVRPQLLLGLLPAHSSTARSHSSIASCHSPGPVAGIEGHEGWAAFGGSIETARGRQYRNARRRR